MLKSICSKRTHTDVLDSSLMYEQLEALRKLLRNSKHHARITLSVKLLLYVLHLWLVSNFNRCAVKIRWCFETLSLVWNHALSVAKSWWVSAISKSMKYSRFGLNVRASSAPNVCLRFAPATRQITATPEAKINNYALLNMLYSNIGLRLWAKSSLRFHASIRMWKSISE